MIDLNAADLIADSGDKADLFEAVTAASRTRSMDEPSQLQLDVRDAKKRLARARMLKARCWIDVDGLSYELDIVDRSDAASMSLSFLDSAAAKLLRPAQSVITVKAGTTSRGAFAQRLCREARVKALIDPALFATVATEDLTRGSESDPTESSWAALARTVETVQARRFSDGRQIIVGSDAWLLGRARPLDVRENEAGVGSISWTLDDKDVSTATLQVFTDRWELPQGHPVRLVNEGPASGLWLVQSVSDEAGTREGSVTLVRKQPLLDEPDPAEGEGDAGRDGRDVDAAATDPGGTGSAALERGIAWGKARVGRVKYRYTATGPDAYDCSAWTQAIARAAGVSIPRTAGAQRTFCRPVSVEVALRTRGALLFDIGGGRGASGNHVAMSLGGDTTLEARGTGTGVGVFNNAAAQGWTHGGLIPGL